MGFNTTVLILNDGLTEIQADPKAFVEGICSKLHDGGDVRVGNFCNPVYVMPTAHADMFRLYTSHGNSLVELSHYQPRTRRLLGDKHSREVVLRLIKLAKSEIRALEAFIKANPLDEADSTSQTKKG